MKTNTIKLPAIVCMAFFAGISSSMAQDQSGNFLKAGLDDGNKLIKAYLTPTMNNFAQGINDGWNNTAKPLGLWGIDFRLNVGVGIMAVRDQSYNFNEIGLNTDKSKPYLRLPDGRDPNFPTLYGAEEQNPPKIDVRANVNGRDTSIAMFTALNGVGSYFSPTLPLLQFSVGLPKNTELSLRYFPKIAFPKDYRSGLFGFALKHDLVQWIPKYADLSVNEKRPFDLSVFFGFTTYTGEYTKTLLAVDTFAYNPDPSILYNNQRIIFTGNSWTFGAIISKEFNPWRPNIHVEPYLGVNYAYSATRFRFEGDYPIPVANDEYSAAHPEVSKIQRVSNPVNIEGTLSNVRANAGVRLKIYAVTLSGEYSIGRINTITASLGLNFQSLKPFKL